MKELLAMNYITGLIQARMDLGNIPYSHIVKEESNNQPLLLSNQMDPKDYYLSLEEAIFQNISMGSKLQMMVDLVPLAKELGSQVNIPYSTKESILEIAELSESMLGRHLMSMDIRTLHLLIETDIYGPPIPSYRYSTESVNLNFSKDQQLINGVENFYELGQNISDLNIVLQNKINLGNSKELSLFNHTDRFYMHWLEATTKTIKFLNECYNKTINHNI